MLRQRQQNAGVPRHAVLSCRCLGNALLHPVGAADAPLARMSGTKSNVLDLRAEVALEAAALHAALPTPDEGEVSLRRQAIPTWLGRMTNEYGSARVFDAMADHARSLDFHFFATLVAEFANEERRHGVLCGAVAQVLGGEAINTALPDATYPRHPDATSPVEGLLRNVMSVCCLSETVAVALIGAELEEMPQGALADRLRSIWADEIGHSRVGWTFFHEHARTLSALERASLGRYLVHALDHLEAHELAHIPPHAVPPTGGERFGMCSGADARTLMYRTIEQVILPSLAQSGITPVAEPHLPNADG